MFDLTEEQYQLLIKVHDEHMRYQGSENKEKYKLENIQNVVWDEKENCLKVYYSDIWWHYTKKMEWY